MPRTPVSLNIRTAQLNRIHKLSQRASGVIPNGHVAVARRWALNLWEGPGLRRPVVLLSFGCLEIVRVTGVFLLGSRGLRVKGRVQSGEMSRALGNVRTFWTNPLPRPPPQARKAEIPRYQGSRTSPILFSMPSTPPNTIMRSELLSHTAVCRERPAVPGSPWSSVLQQKAALLSAKGS